LIFNGNTLTVGGTSGTSGNIIEALNTTGNPVMSVSYGGALYLKTKTAGSLNAAGSPNTVLTIPIGSNKAFYFDYYVNNSSTGAYRSGTIISITNGSSATFSELSSPDLVASTDDISFNVVISGGTDLVLKAIVLAGTWTVSISARII
jgi:hypothetical protein